MEDYMYMKKYRSFIFIAFIFLLVLILPLIGSHWANGSRTTGFGLFPAQLMESPLGFNLTYFIAFSFFALFVLMSILPYTLFWAV